MMLLRLSAINIGSEQNSNKKDHPVDHPSDKNNNSSVIQQQNNEQELKEVLGLKDI